MVRPATLEDLETLVEGNLRMALETEDLALDPEVLRAGVRAVLSGAQPGEYFVLQEEGRIVALLVITYEWSDWRNGTVWWIQSVYVPPEARGRGAYRTLYHEVLERARTAGAKGVRLYVDERNTAAQEVYTKLGMDGGHYRVFEHML